MRAGLRTLKLGTSAHIWYPAYICKSAVGPALDEGWEVRHYDVDEELRPIEGTLGPRKGDVVVCVRFFGHSTPVLELPPGVFRIEDGAHSLPTVAGGPHGEDGDVSIFSLRKAFGLPDGGLLIARGHTTVPPAATARIDLSRVAAVVARRAAAVSQLNLTRLKDRRFEAPSQIPSPSITQLSARLLSSVRGAEATQRRQSNCRRVADAIRGEIGVRLPLPHDVSSAAPQALPIWHDRARELIHALRRAGVEASSWPGVELPESVDLARYPGARSWVGRTVLLPTQQDLSERDIHRMILATREALASVR